MIPAALAPLSGTHTPSPVFNGANAAGIMDSRLFTMSIVVMLSHIFHLILGEVP
jgi:hypothetical protein